MTRGQRLILDDPDVCDLCFRNSADAKLCRDDISDDHTGR